LLASRNSSECRCGDMQVWLLTFVRNGAIDRLSEADSDIAGQELSQWASGIASGAYQPRQAVEALPIPYREVVVLRDIYGLRYQNIADITQASVSTVAMRVACARQLLADWLQDVSSARTSKVL
jgi:DNA-directed RNA polymerase specialized sigma24 family protein